jgi:hypothetical protein
MTPRLAPLDARHVPRARELKITAVHNIPASLLKPSLIQ